MFLTPGALMDRVYPDVRRYLGAKKIVRLISSCKCRIGKLSVATISACIRSSRGIKYSWNSAKLCSMLKLKQDARSFQSPVAELLHIADA